jgi:hypothetical protein
MREPSAVAVRARRFEPASEMVADARVGRGGEALYLVEARGAYVGALQRPAKTTSAGSSLT